MTLSRRQPPRQLVDAALLSLPRKLVPSTRKKVIAPVLVLSLFFSVFYACKNTLSQTAPVQTSDLDIAELKSLRASKAESQKEILHLQEEVQGLTAPVDRYVYQAHQNELDMATSCASFLALSSNSTNNRVTRVTQSNNAGNPFDMHLYSNNDIVSKEIRSHGGWERKSVLEFNKYFTDYSKKNNIPLSDLTFVDIGANVGWFALSMAALGVNVLAFEPMEENINLLRQSICLPQNIQSGVSKRITLFGHGLGSKEETCIIYSHNINVGDGHVKCVEKESDLQIPHDYSIRGRIPVRRLDDVISVAEQGMKVVVVKMDVEGYEGNVLEGGTKFFLESDISIISTEFVPKWIKEKGGDPEEFKRKFSSAGYGLREGGETLTITKN